MNVLHIIQLLRIGGTEQVIKDLAIHASTVRPFVCALREVGYCAQEIRRHGIEVSHLGKPTLKGNNIPAVKFLVQVIRKYQIDVVHCHDMGSWQCGLQAGKLAGVRRIFYSRHSILENYNYKIVWLSRLLSLFTSRMIAVSPELKQDMIRREQLNGSRIDVIYNGVDIDRYDAALSRKEAKARIGIREDQFVIGSVTRFFKVKNIEMQVEMVAKLKDRIPNLRHLIVAPVSDYGRRIEDVIRRQGLGNHIQLLGFREDVPELLKAMDVFVLTSFTEGTCMALLEAMAARCIPVVSAVGGNVHLIEHSRNGLLFDVNDVEALCRSIHNIYNDPELKTVLRRNAYDSVQKFSVAEMVKNYENLYRQH